jgi:hypothetical protein
VRTKKFEPLPTDPIEALARIIVLAEELKEDAEEARRYADNALDKVQDAANKAADLHHLLDYFFCDRRNRGEPEPSIWAD